MEKVRLTQQSELARIKLDTRVQYYSSSVPRKEIVERTRVGSSDLTKYGDDNEPDRFMPVDVLVDVSRITGNPVVLRTVAELCGYDIVAKDDDAGRPAAASDEMMLHVTAEFGDLVREYMDAKRDGVLDQLDKQRIRREGQQAVSAILSFLKGL